MEETEYCTYPIVIKIAFRLGQIVGQPLGGLLSHPARNMRLFDTPFWREYPFLLPCLIASFIGMLSIVLAWFRLEEVSRILYYSRIVVDHESY